MGTPYNGKISKSRVAAALIVAAVGIALREHQRQSDYRAGYEAGYAAGVRNERALVGLRKALDNLMRRKPEYGSFLEYGNPDGLTPAMREEKARAAKMAEEERRARASDQADATAYAAEALRGCDEQGIPRRNRMTGRISMMRSDEEQNEMLRQQVAAEYGCSPDDVIIGDPVRMSDLHSGRLSFSDLTINPLPTVDQAGDN